MADKPDNIWSLYRRDQKVTRLLAALDAETNGQITEAQANKLDQTTLKRALARAEIKTASAKTIAALVERIRNRDVIRQNRVSMPKGIEEGGK